MPLLLRSGGQILCYLGSTVIIRQFSFIVGPNQLKKHIPPFIGQGHT